MKINVCVVVMALWVCGCSDDVQTPDAPNPEEVITTITLTLTPQGGGEAIVATFRDADGEGGEAPVTTPPGPLMQGVMYDATIELLNETVPQSDEEYNIGNEIKEEAQEHQFFYTGTAVENGLLQVTYADKESDYGENEGDDLPVGIKTVFSAQKAGMGTLNVVLKHQPPLNGEAVKTGNRDAGGTDVDVTFEMQVN